MCTYSYTVHLYSLIYFSILFATAVALLARLVAHGGSTHPLSHLLRCLFSS